MTGSFIVIDEATNDTVGAAMIVGGDSAGGYGGSDRATTVSENVFRQPLIAP